MEWEYNENITSISIYCNDPSRTRNVTLIATVNKNGRQKDNAIKNARLIAAAPDLLEACKAVLQAKSEGRVHPDEPDSYETAIKKIELAIAKAEGSQL